LIFEKLLYGVVLTSITYDPLYIFTLTH